MLRRQNKRREQSKPTKEIKQKKKKPEKMQLDQTGPQSSGNNSNDSSVSVQCCVCGLVIPANPTNMCIKCVQSHINITKDLIKEYIVVYCPECDRYLQPPKLWSRAPPESRELMTICLKKIKGLAQFHLADAQFLWTEPHSKRLKLALTLQKELYHNAIVQQQFHVEFVVQWRQCEFCSKIATGQPQWDAVVQLRQKAEHKRTLLFLEQLVLKHHMHDNAISIEAHPDGIDFFFGHRSHGLSFIDFVQQNAPATRRDAVQLVSHDSKSNTAVQHHTFSIEIAPLCREDLVCFPKPLYNTLGGFGPLVLVHKVYSSIVFICPRTLRSQQMEASLYWKMPFPALANVQRLTTFYVLSIEQRGVVNGKLQLADIEVCLEDEVGGDRRWTVTSHLGGILKEGDLVKGYHVSALNPNNDFIGAYSQDSLPEVVLVRKHYENQIKRRSERTWRIRQLDVAAGNTTGGRRALDQRERDLEEFKDELERDPELRKDVQLFFDPMSRAAHDAAKARDAGETGITTIPGATRYAAAAAEDEAMVDLAELVDELQVSDSRRQRGAGVDEGNDGEEDDEGVAIANPHTGARRG